MKRFLTVFIFSVAWLLLSGCGEKVATKKTALEESVEQDIDSFHLESAVLSLYPKYLPDLKPCIVLVNQYIELGVYYDEEFEMIWVFVPTVLGFEDWEYTLNGKSMKGKDRAQGEIYAFIKNEKTSVKKYTLEQLRGGGLDQDIEGVNPENVSFIGHGVKFDETDKVVMEGVSTCQHGTMNFKISYTPNEGWKYKCDDPDITQSKGKADVFGFSNKSLLSQFKEVFKNKKECLFRLNRPHFYSKPIKFTHEEYVLGVDDFDSSNFSDITVGEDFIRIDGQKLTDLTTMKWKVREILQRLCLFQITSEEFSPYYIAISEGSNDDLVRLLFSELDQGDMTNFNMRIVPKHVTSEK